MRIPRFTLVVALILFAVQPWAVAQGQAPTVGHTARVNDIEMYYEKIIGACHNAGM
ncbi:MAG TPA: hypothetical protein VGK99_21695 [Acidobacteriota bacterium]|jgi:hypothetical protein